MSLSSINIFKKAQLGGIQPSCRILRSSTYEGMASEDGTSTKTLEKCYSSLAKGGCGLIISGGVFVEPEGRIHEHQLGLVSQAQIDSVARLVQTVHYNHGLIAIQLNHAGLEAKTKITGLPPAGPSPNSKKSRALTKSEIDRIINSFVQAAHTAYGIGADAVQLHAAHGYLLGQFLSPIWNKRSDEFGGSVEKRFEIVKRILTGIRQSVPKSFTVFIKMNGSDIEKGGITIEDAMKTAKLAEKAGVDGLEISSGSGRKPYSLLGDIAYDKIFKDPKRREAMKKRFSDIHFIPHFNEDFAAKIKKVVNVPIISVGGYRTKQEIEAAIKSGKCDFVSLSRPFIREPSLVNSMKNGQCDGTSCVRCNQCFFKTMAGKPIKCYYY